MKPKSSTTRIHSGQNQDDLNSKSTLNQSQDPKLSYGDYLRFRDLVHEHSGLFFPEKKKQDLEIGLFKVLAETPLASTNGAYNLDHYYNLLRDKNNPTGLTEMSRLINALTVGETHFFRDEAQFNALATHVLPTLIARKRAAAAAIGPDIQPQLRIWSAGCATGEEPYSLAMLLKELLPDIEKWHIFILATDISQDALNRARQARYTDWSFREGRAKALQPRYFTWKPDTYPKGAFRLQDNITRMVTFAPLNLVQDTYPAIHNNTISMDLILCRNVTIYFTEETTQNVVKNFYQALVNGGWLVVGHSEPSLVIYKAFQARNVSNAMLYQKTGQPTPWPDDWAWLNQADDTGAAETPIVTAKHRAAPALAPQTDPSFIEPKKEVAANASFPPPIKKKDFARTQGLMSSVVDSYEIAGVLLNKGHIEEAIAELHQKLALDPNYAPAHSLLGRAYANKGQWLQARQWCESALELDSLLSEAYYVLALVYDHEGRLEPAIDLLKKAIYLERDTPLFHFNLAVLYKKMGQIKSARRTCQNAVRILEQWPPGSIVPDTGGATAKHLLEAVKRILNELEIY